MLEPRMRFLAEYEDKFRAQCADNGLDPDDDEYGAVAGLVRVWFGLGLEAAGVPRDKIYDPTSFRQAPPGP
jgi:hypothetical protein